VTALVLTRADVALWSDPESSRVVLDRLQVLAPADVFEVAFQRFEGDDDATGFRGEGQGRTYQMTARFLSGEHATAAALVALFRTAHRDDPDGRIQLRTHAGEVGGLNAMEAVLVSGVNQAWAKAGQLDISWTATTVLYSIEA
jgi:hypothetical protein